MTPDNNKIAISQPKSEMEYIPFGADTKIRLSVKIVQNMVCTPTKSGKVCTERDALRFMMLCQAQKLNPFAGDAFLIGYDAQNGPSFSLITAHQAFLKRAEASPDFDGMLSGVILEIDGEIVEREGDFHLPSEKVLGGWAKVFHKKRAFQIYRRIRLERFNQGRAEWAKDPAGMICKCAEADALRSTFPTLCGGMHFDGTVQQLASDIQVAGRDEPVPMAQLSRADVDRLEHEYNDPNTTAPAPEKEKATHYGSALIEALQEAGVTEDAFAKWAFDNGYLTTRNPNQEPLTFSEVVKEILPKAIENMFKNVSLIIADIFPVTKKEVVKADEKLVTPEKEKQADDSVLGQIRAKAAKEGIKETQILAWCKQEKKILPGIQTLDELAESSPSVCGLILNNFAKVVALIKTK